MAWDDDWLRNDPTMVRGSNYGFNASSVPSFSGIDSNNVGDYTALANLKLLQDKPGSNYYTGGTVSKGIFGDATPEWMQGWTGTGMEGVGSVFKGLGGLAQGWAAIKNLGLAREAMTDQRNQWNKNYESQRTAVNNQIANQNAWKQAQGRTDYGSYVGGKPSGTNYVG